MWMWGLARLMHSAGFMGFLARPHAEWRWYRMEHLDPWFNNDCVGEIERGKNREGEKKAEEWKVNVCVCVCERECENCCGCRSLIAARLPVVSISWGLVSAGSPQHNPRFVSVSLPLLSPPEPLEKKERKGPFTAVQRLFSLTACESGSEPPVWPPLLFRQSSFGVAKHFATLR